MSPCAPAPFSSRLAVSAFFAMTLGFFGPAWVYFGNSQEFSHGFASVLPFLAGLVLALGAVCMLLLHALPETPATKLLGLVFAAALLLWLQGNLLVWDYGLLDGHDIVWEQTAQRGWIDTPLWLLIPALAIAYSRRIEKNVRTLSLLLIAVQAAGLLVFLGLRAPQSGLKRYGIDDRRQFSFSRSRNILVVVLDTFQADLFQELLLEDRGLAKAFSGFTYFRNSLGGSPSTNTAIPEILTARLYDNSLPLKDFLKAAYLERSLPLLLKKNRYRCDLFPLGSIGLGMFLDPKLASNLRELAPATIRHAAFLVDLSLFRQLPHLAKKAVYNRQNWLLTRAARTIADPGRRRPARKNRVDLLPDRQFVEAMASKAAADTPQPVFKFFHLRGLHPPLRMNEDCRLERMDFNRRNYRRQAAGLLKLMSAFLARLRQIGAFDNSLIFIVGDHGPGNWGLHEINTRSLGLDPPPATPRPEWMRAMAGALPLMLVKPAGDSGQALLAVSDAPACLGDIAVTAATAAGLESGLPGRPLFALTPAEARPRRHLHYEGFRINRQGFMNPMSEYWVQGFSWLEESWQAGPRRFQGGSAAAGTPAAGNP